MVFSYDFEYDLSYSHLINYLHGSTTHFSRSRIFVFLEEVLPKFWADRLYKSKDTQQ